MAAVIDKARCHLHPTVDTSHLPPRLKKSLSEEGMDELLPAFVLVGVKGEEHLKMLCSLSDYKTQWAFQSDLVHLNELQMMVTRKVMSALAIETPTV